MGEIMDIKAEFKDGILCVELPKKEIAKEEITPEFNQKVGSLFSSFKDSDETFTTYSVYILRQDETIQTINSKIEKLEEELENGNEKQIENQNKIMEAITKIAGVLHKAIEGHAYDEDIQQKRMDMFSHIHPLY